MLSPLKGEVTDAFSLLSCLCVCMILVTRLQSWFLGDSIDLTERSGKAGRGNANSVVLMVLSTATTSSSVHGNTATCYSLDTEGSRKRLWKRMVPIEDGGFLVVPERHTVFPSCSSPACKHKDCRSLLKTRQHDSLYSWSAAWCHDADSRFIVLSTCPGTNLLSGP